MPIRPARKWCSVYTAISGVLIITVLFVLTLIPIIIWQLADRHAERHVIAWAVGGIGVCLAVPLAVHDMVGHWLHWKRPEVQMYYIRILGMIPIYSIESWFALRYKSSAPYLEALRDLYEAYVIYNFFMLLMRLIGSNQDVIRAFKRSGCPDTTTQDETFKAAVTKSTKHEDHLVDESNAQTTVQIMDDGKALSPIKIPNSNVATTTETRIHHMIPMCFLPRWKLGSSSLYHAELGVFQYVLIKLICTIVTLITYTSGEFGEGEFTNFSKAYIYVTLLVNFSQLWAMYNLVLFYKTLRKEYTGRNLKPIGKMLCIKGIVFFTFWQGVLISGLVTIGVIKPTLTYTTDEVAKGLQDFIITIEMICFAIAHHYYFSHKDFGHIEATPGTQTPFLKAFVNGIVPVDVVKHTEILWKRKRSESMIDEKLLPEPTESLPASSSSTK